ncbi:MAG: chromosome partitioning protein [Actinomycetota bacterium]|nr:chromosome partitioning protein [Actinomycetota bacterium]
MTTPVLLAVTGSALESSVITALQHAERAGVHIVRRCVDLADLVAAAATGRAVAALVAADVPHLDADVVSGLRAAGVEPLGVATADTPGAVHRLHQIGIAVVLTDDGARDLATQVVESLERTEQHDPGAATPTAPEEVPAGLGEVVAVWGPAGAPGRSTVAVGLAAELAGLGRSALLVDADVYGGSVAQHLALLDDVSGLLAAARNAKVGTLDAAALAAHCRAVGAMRVLTGLPRPDRWPELSPAAMSAVLACARTLAAFVVVDCGFSLEADEDLMFDTAAPRRNGATLCALEQADRVLAVGAADPVGLSRLARGVVDLAAAVPGCEPSVVLNRMRAGVGWSAGEATALLERFTGRGTTVVLPEDRAACDHALVHGRTLAECAPTSPLRRVLRELAAGLAGVPAPGTGHRRRLRAVP